MDLILRILPRRVLIPAMAVAVCLLGAGLVLLIQLLSALV